MKKLSALLFSVLLLASCVGWKAQEFRTARQDAVVYEMNIRQATPEGTFAAVTERLDDLAELGVDMVWVMPPYPIGELGRKGTMGSYYAIRDYCAINPEFGTIEDFDAFVAKAHSLGMRVILDWVANHTSPDHPWVTECPAQWYERDEEGKTKVEYDWYDIAALNYDCPEMRLAMMDCMRFWLDRGIDGFRCDVAYEVPEDFWAVAIPAMRSTYGEDIYFLAEGEVPWLHEVGFDASYAWRFHHLLNDIAQGKAGVAELVEYLKWNAEEYPADALRLSFTSNHDENSWAGTEFTRMGEAVKAMTVLCWTLPCAQPLIYTGQEIGYDDSFEFFEKDPIMEYKANEWTDFYREMACIRHSLATWQKGQEPDFELISSENNTLIYTRRKADGGKIRVSVQLESPWAYSIENVERITRVEPLSWWVGMKTPLQLLIGGEQIGSCDVAIVDGKGASGKVKVTKVHKADSPNFLFADVEVASNASAGTYWIVVSKDGEQICKYPYEISERRSGSAQRKSFTTADAIYLIMPDRFADGDTSIDSTPDTKEKANRNAFFGRHGGDIAGIMDHLDYISELGMTAIWCTPMLLDDARHGSYHGYACSDYYHIDPRYGTNELYRDFVSKSHEKDLKVIMDVVTNHCGTEHWWMEEAPFEDWVHRFPEYTGTNVCFSTNMDPNASRKDLYIQESGWFVPSMPDMNLDNPYVLQYFKQWGVWWIEYADLDGYRVDTYPYNEKNPMSQWCAAVRNEYPNFNIVGECWTSSIPQLAYWQADNANKDGFNSNLPSIMDFPLQEAICRGVPNDFASWGEGMTRIYDCLSHDFVYQDLSKMMIFPGNHDTDRIGDVVKANPERLKIVMAMMATMRGFPQIFAGDEMMFLSKDLSQGHGGLRVDFPGGWEGDEYDLFTAEGRQNASIKVGYKTDVQGLPEELFNYVSRLFQWRKTAEVVHSGKTLQFLSRDNTYGYFRYNDTDAVFVYINNSGEDKTIPWSYYDEITASLDEGRDVITGEPVTITDSTTVPAHGVIVVEFKRNVQ